MPVNNNLSKAVAFAPSLDLDYFRKNRLRKPQGFISPLDTIENLQKQGWHLDGVAEKYESSDNKVKVVQARMTHPDMAMRKAEGQIEGTPNIYIRSNLRNSDMDIFMGLYRIVCENGMIRANGDKFYIHSENDLPRVLNSIESEANLMIRQFNDLKEHELAQQIQRQLAREALQIRFGSNSSIDYMQLLNCHRKEDEGNDVWHVFNRLQENLIKPNMIKTRLGHNLTGVFDIEANREVNDKLYQKVITPYLN